MFKSNNANHVSSYFAYVQRQGYLDIVKWLCDDGGAATLSNGVRGVDIRSKAGWTPLSKAQYYECMLHINSEYLLVNASSKGHLPVVLYLLTKQLADPLVRNKWGESAYDVAAAVFEIWICEVGLQTLRTQSNLTIP